MDATECTHRSPIGDDEIMTIPNPVIPDYSGANISGVVPGILLSSPGTRPDWFPAPLANATSVVLLLIDGLGWNQLRERAERAPFLSGMQGGPITTVGPSTTASALTSLATGASPLEHGIVGYRMDMGDGVMNSLRWTLNDRDMRKVFEPTLVQPIPPFAGHSVPVVSRADLENTAFTYAHLRGSRPNGWRTPSSIITQCARLASHAGERFVYAYYDGLDKTAHECGLGANYDDELSFVDWLVASLHAALPSSCTLVVMADHGQVHVGNNVVELPENLMRLVHHQSGEGRFRWLHARRGHETELSRMCRDLYADRAWVTSKEQVVDEAWLGPVRGGRGQDAAIRRLGDVALVPYTATTFHDPMDSGPFTLIGRHGSLTADEMLVPLLASTRP